MLIDPTIRKIQGWPAASLRTAGGSSPTIGAAGSFEPRIDPIVLRRPAC